jgi:hypothetical protein
VFNESPEGLHFYAGLDSIEAKKYQQIAGSFIVGITQTGTSVPENYYLGQNYPNPFNPVTKIRFSIPHPGNVILNIFDETGKEVKTLVKAKLNAGSYEVFFDAALLASGIYFYKIIADNFTDCKKMIVVK